MPSFRPTFDRTRARARQLIAFVATCVVFLFGVWVINGNTHRLDDTNKAVERTYQVIAALEKTLATVVDAEAGQRGFTLTGDSTFLNPYTGAGSRVRSLVRTVEALTTDNGSQQVRVRQLREQIDARFTELDRVVSLRRVSEAGALTAVRTGRGRNQMDAIRATIAAMQSEERRLMVIRSDRITATLRQSTVVTILTAALGLLMLALLYGFVRRNDRLQQTLADTTAEQREQLQITLASIGDGVISTDSEGNVTYMNAVAEGLTGWTLSEATAQPLTQVFDIVNEATRAPVENPAMRALRDGVIVGLANHTILKSRDGSERPIDDSAAPIRAADGRVAGCVLVFRDISERYAAERRDRTAQQDMSATLESITDGFMRIDGDWRLRYVNAEAQRLTRLPTSATLGQSLWELYPEIVGTTLERRYRECAASQQAIDFDHYSERLHRAFAVRCYPTHDGGISVYLRDITERKRSESNLRETQAELAFAVESAGLGEWSLDLADNTARRTLRHDEIFGYSTLLPEWTYDMFLAHVHPDDRPRVDQAFQDAVATAGIWDIECRIVRADGVERYIWTKARIKHGADGKVERMLGIVGDVTEQRQLETRRAEAERALRAADRRKDEFLATLAHELRNPLAPIRTGLEIMRLAGPNMEVIDKVRGMMDRQMQQMVRLVDDLLDISRITSGKLELQRERFALQRMIDMAVETSRPHIDGAGHTLQVVAADTVVLMDGDVIRLAQVVSNLLSNSARYTPAGGTITLTIVAEPRAVMLSVRDDGIGIPSTMLESIFDMFTQVDRRLEKVSGGLGLGLSLVKAIVDGHDGTVTAQSDGDGLGSEFLIRLPRVHAENGTHA